MAAGMVSWVARFALGIVPRSHVSLGTVPAKLSSDAR
jgi:hypothetical protein